MNIQKFHANFLGCPSTLKNKDGKLARIIAKENEHKEAMKECKKAERAEAKGRGSKPGTEPWAIRVRSSSFFVLFLNRL